MTEEPKDQGKRPAYQPSHYMRERHPDLFSDSHEQVEYDVTREVLSYHLQTLTNQKDESAFEHFAHRLCEKFIAPNLRPQTGPVGGGDGKTDAETYPVAKEISIRWSCAEPDKAGERKAFAFSAKEKWRDKVRSDVASIASTGRNYDHIYFVTNQFVSSRASAEMQDELGKTHGIPLTILDKTWLLDRVFLHDSMDIAVDELGVGKGSGKLTKKLGPKDAERAAELDAIETRMRDGSAYKGQPHHLAEDAGRASILSRSLGHSASEMNGRFERAVRIAKEHGLRKHELAAYYDWAWTSYFWLEDYKRTSELYDEVERLALGSDDAEDLERLNNLLAPLRMGVFAGGIDAEAAKLKARTEALKAALERVTSQTSRANNALHAEAMLLMTRMSELSVEGDADPLIDVWVKFTDVIKRAEGLGTFPFTSIANALTEVGRFVPESAEFDTLYEAITDALAARSSEGEAATKNVQRAYQKLEKGLPYEAIRWFGRAVTLLIKEEYEDEMLRALIGAGIAFEKVGLPWAARNYTLAALSQQFAGFSKSGSISGVRSSVLARYFATELYLGRLPQILSAHELELMVRNAQAQTEVQRRRLGDVQQSHMMMIGALLLRTPFSDLNNIRQLPDSLERLALPMCRIALLHLMGHEEALRDEGWIPPEEAPEGVEEYFTQWYAEAETMELPAAPDFCLGDQVTLISHVLGCTVEVTCANNLTSIGIGEALLGALEAFLATSLQHRILPLLERVQIRIAPDVMPGFIPEITFMDEDGTPVGIIRHPPKLNYTTREEALSFPNWLKDAMLEVMTTFIAPTDVETWGKALFEDEKGLDRALTFSNIPTMLGNLHGDKNSLLLSEWIDAKDKVYDIKRSTAWPTPKADEPEGSLADAVRGDGLPPEGMFDKETQKHSNTKWVSPIDAQKWDAAKWNGTIFMWSPPGPNMPPPMMGLAYKNSAPAQDIFRAWSKRYGNDDVNDELQITIVRGISAANPAAYAVMVGPNLAKLPKTQGAIVGIVSRINRMYPKTTANLDAFLADYERHGRFVLIPAHLPNVTGAPEPMFDLPIGKHNLVVRNAWEIGPNDITTSALDLDDPPYIPPGQTDAPVTKAIAWLRKLRDKG